eukprot:14698943-Alexandrium_andersonii.AAC.1
MTLNPLDETLQGGHEAVLGPTQFKLRTPGATVVFGKAEFRTTIGSPPPISSNGRGGKLDERRQGLPTGVLAVTSDTGSWSPTS